MPNWCVNQVDVQGDEAEVAKLVAFVKSDESNFDFSKIVPIPTSPFYSINENQQDFQCGCGKDNTAEHKIQESNGTITQDVAMVFGGNAVCVEHNVPRNSSHPDWWYNWNVRNWGTKWSAGEVWNDRLDDDNKVDGHTSYNFDTAWSPAEPVIAALAEKFPALSITHRYCEGGMGFAGQVVYLNGVESLRDEYDSGEAFPDEAWIRDEDGSNTYERDYDKVPMTAYESFCEEHFGGIVGG
jgi:hypothetical protein